MDSRFRENDGTEVTRMAGAGVVCRMRVGLSPVVALPLAALTLACSSMTEPTVDARLTVDASSYIAVSSPTLQLPAIYQFTIVARFRNDGNTEAHLDRCYPDSPHPLFTVVLRSSDTRKSSGYDAPWACVGHNNPIVVAPNETRVDTLVIFGPTAWDGSTQKPLGEMEGTFQLMYFGDACKASNGCRSKPFAVQLGK